MYLYLCVFKSEREQEAEENSLMHADLKLARETIEELKHEKGIERITDDTIIIRVNK